MTGVAAATGLVLVAVLSVHDGDTFSARYDDGREVKVRVLGIDTPELRGACDAEHDAAIAARDRAKQLLGDRVFLSPTRADKYGRLLAHVVLLDGRDLDDVLIGEGLGRPYWGEARKGWCRGD